MGKRKKIDDYIKKREEDVKVVFNDFENEEVTIFTAIRDYFSHQEATFNKGEKLDIEKELKENLKKLKEVVRGTILDELFSNLSII